jgi:AbrB family looped-hinge helix DNA binding protein
MSLGGYVTTMDNVVRTKVTQGGRIVIPADMRRRLGIEVGEDVSIALDGESLRIVTQKESIKRAQALVSKFVPKGVSLVDELVADRRREAANE